MRVSSIQPGDLADEADTIPGALQVYIPMLPPSVNNMYATVARNGTTRRVPSKAAKAWRTLAAPIIGQAIAAQRQAVLPGPKRPYIVDIVYYGPRVFLWDVDNKAKLPLDLLGQALAVDDRYVMDLRQRKRRAPLDLVYLQCLALADEADALALFSRC